MASTSDFSSYIDADEKVLWTGEPYHGLMLRPEDAFAVPFGLFFLAFALFWEASVLGITFQTKNPPPILFPLWGLLFVGIGTYLAFGRFFWDADVRDHTSYALTDRRALILRHWPTRSVRTVAVTPSTEISTAERGDGSGTIYFGPRIVNNPWGRRSWPGTPEGFSFDRIGDIREALRIVRSMQK